MADRPQTQPRYEGGVKTLQPKRGPSATQILAIVTLLPVGGTLLALAGLTLVGSLIGLAVTTPLFVIFSPVLVPAVLLFVLAVTGVLSSGAFGLTGLSSLSWVFNFFRQKAGVPGSMQEQLDYAKRRMQDVTMQAGQKTKDAGQAIQSRAQEGGGGREAAK